MLREKRNSMKRILMVMISMYPLVLYSYNPFDTWHYVDFDTSMRAEQWLNAQVVYQTQKVFNMPGMQVYNFFKELYEKNNPTNRAPQSTLKIPKIIHQIWLGSPVPEIFKPLMKGWQELHPDWEYKLWTDENVHEVTLYNQAFYDATDNYGVKSDILKWELIYQFGGVYIDVDFEALQPLDMFHYLYDFYTGIQPLDAWFVQLGAALFGGVPGHPILKHCIETVKDDWHFKGAPTKTGPVHFTKSFLHVAGTSDLIDIAFPASYFYPLGCREEPPYEYKKWFYEGAYAIHHWSKSWMPRHYRPRQFRDLGNDASTKSWND